MANQRQRVAVSRNNGGCGIQPGPSVGAGFRHYRSRGSGGIVPQARSRPIVGHCIRAVDAVVQRELRDSNGSRERLRDGTVAVGLGGAAQLCRVSASVRMCHHRSGSRSRPASQAVCFKCAVGDARRRRRRRRDRDIIIERICGI